MGVSTALDQLQLGDHVCLPVDRHAGQQAIASAYVDVGLRGGHKVVFFADDPAALRRHLHTQRPSTRRALDNGQVEVHSAADKYLVDGALPVERLLADVEPTLEAVHREGYRGLLLSGDLSGTRFRSIDGDALTHYETRFNEHAATHDIIGLCHYDPCAFTPQTWRRLAAAHPQTVAERDGDQATGFRCRRTPRGIRITGEVDVANRAALTAVLEIAIGVTGECQVDASGLAFADGSSLACLLRAAAVRGERPTTITCNRHIAEMLEMLGAPTVPALRVLVAEYA